MSPLTALAGKKKSFKWTPEHSRAFQEVRSMVAQDTMVVHPNFDKPFVLHTDASNQQIGGVLSQAGKPIGYFSKKFTAAQNNYTVGEKELLGIVETLKYFKNILLGNKITIFTDHKNLTYPTTNHKSDRILRQRLLIEEYGADVKYVSGRKNIVADALSRLPMSTSHTDDECFLNRRAFEDSVVFPLDLNHLARLQSGVQICDFAIFQSRRNFLNN